MKPSKLHESLIERGYTEVERWRIDHVLEFIRRELATPAWPLQLTVALLGFAVLFGFTQAYWHVEDGAHWLIDILVPFGAGCLAMLVVVVPHELLHGLAYMLTGAPQIKYGAEWRRLIFHASAPYHAINPRQLTFVALLPLAVITLLLGAALVILAGWWWWFCFGLLLMHTQGSIGDLAMVSFFLRQDEESQWLTYDASDTAEFVLLRKSTAELH